MAVVQHASLQSRWINGICRNSFK